MRRRIIAVLMAVMLLAVFAPATVFATSDSVYMTGYDQVIKKKNTVYCAGTGGIYRVILKNGKVKSKKRIVKNEYAFAPKSYQCAMRLKGNYLYFLSGGEGTGGSLCRVRSSGGKVKRLATNIPLSDQYFKYAIKGTKIYYYTYKLDEDYNIAGIARRMMSLNGKNKSKTSKKAVLKHKKRNVKGYSVRIKTSGSYYKDYLKTPKGSFYLGKAKQLG